MLKKIGPKQILLSSGTARLKAIKLLDYGIGTLLASLLPGREEAAIPKKTPDSILVIRPGGIGDAVFLLPFLRQLARLCPGLAVDILCERRNAEIFRSQTGLCRNIYLYDSWRTFPPLFAHHYDLILDTEQWHYLSVILARRLKPTAVSGFATRPLRTKLLDQKIPYEIDAYETENFKKLFTPICPATEAIRDINNCFAVPEPARRWAKENCPEESVSLFLGASIPERRLTEEQSCGIIELALKKNKTVILLGGRDATEKGRRLAEKYENSGVKNFSGQVSLVQSAALIQQSRLFIGPDSGLMHLACAVGTPVAAIFGPGNLKKWGPRGERHHIITATVSCSPCTLFGYTVPVCAGIYPCLSKINLEQIREILNQNF